MSGFRESTGYARSSTLDGSSFRRTVHHRQPWPSLRFCGLTRPESELPFALTKHEEQSVVRLRLINPGLDDVSAFGSEFDRATARTRKEAAQDHPASVTRALGSRNFPSSGGRGVGPVRLRLGPVPLHFVKETRAPAGSLGDIESNGRGKHPAALGYDPHVPAEEGRPSTRLALRVLPLKHGLRTVTSGRMLIVDPSIPSPRIGHRGQRTVLKREGYRGGDLRMSRPH